LITWKIVLPYSAHCLNEAGPVVDSVGVLSKQSFFFVSHGINMNIYQNPAYSTSHQLASIQVGSTLISSQSHLAEHSMDQSNLEIETCSILI